MKKIDDMTPEEIASLDVQSPEDTRPHPAEVPAMIDGDGVLGSAIPPEAVTITKEKWS
jgi:hypothetical protein